jgi:hypothetical protein
VDKTLLVTLAALVGLTLSIPVVVPVARADGRADRPDVLPVAAIRKGMKGYGLTVFEGTRPERFDVEVIDVLENFRPKQELVLIKTMHPRLDVTKIVAGMSGSPIYIDGKMIGAYAYGWTFGVEPVAGVTPIRSMLDDLARPLPPVLRGSPIKLLPQASADRSGVRSGTSAGIDYDVRAQARALEATSASSSAVAAVSTPLLMSGFSPGALGLARELLEPLGLLPLAAGGSGGGKKASSQGGFVDGGAIGVSLVSGDVSGMGLGTVTRVEGDRLVAFGHPMMAVGVTALPTCEARVLWFMASQMRSFKMGEAGVARGTLVNDRQASIVVHQDARPRTVPVTLSIEGEPGAPYTDWSFEVAHDRFVTPAFLGMAIGSGLEAAAAERRDVTYSLRTRVEFAGFPALEFDDYGSSPTGTPGTSELMEADFLRAVGAAFNNPWQDATLERVDVVAKLHFARDVAVLRAVELLTPEVDPGEAVRIRVLLEPYGMPRESRVLTVTLPPELQNQDVQLEIAPGYEVERPLAPAENLAELLANLQNPTEAPRSLVVSFDSGQTGAAYRGVVADALPLGALDRLSSSHSSLTVARFESARHLVTPLPYYVVGKDRVTVHVAPRLR